MEIRSELGSRRVFLIAELEHIRSIEERWN